MKRFWVLLVTIPALTMFAACGDDTTEEVIKPDEEIVEEYGPYEDIKVVGGKVRFYLSEKKNSTRTATNMTARDWAKSKVVMNGKTYDVELSDEKTPRPYVEVAKAGSYDATLITSASSKWYDESTTEDIKLPHSQIHHYAISNIKSFPMYASYSKSIGNKLIFNDGFAMVMLKLQGTAKISSVKIENPAGKALAGHSTYNRDSGAFLVDEGLEFVALNCTNKGDFVQLSDSKNSNFRLMIAPGDYPEGLTISICDSEHGAMFINTEPLSLAAGDLHVITTKYACREDLIFYEGFDNFVWGGDVMKGSAGYGFSPSADEVGYDSGIELTGYENAFAKVDYNTPGTGLIQPFFGGNDPNKTVADIHQLSDSYITSRNLGNWRHMYCVQEHPGYIVSGIDDASGIVALPNLKEMKDIGDIKINIRFALQNAFAGRLELRAAYGGVIKSAKFNGKEVELNAVNRRYDSNVAISSLAIDNSVFRPSSATAANRWNDLEIVISGATDGTRIFCQNSTISGSSLRFYIDKIEVSRVNYWKESSDLRVMLWNIQNGMISDQHNNYDNFVEWVKKYDPDICIWCESETIYKDKSGTGTSSKFLPDGWSQLCARYGHVYAAVGGNRDNYPQTITSKYPIKTIKRITNTDKSGKPVSHGAGHFQIEVHGKKINFVTMHMWPAAHAFGASNTTTSAAANEGDYYRQFEMQYIVDQTVNNPAYASEEYWLLGGDTNSRSPHDEWFHGTAVQSTAYLPHKHILENTNLKDVISDYYPKNGTYFMTSVSGAARIDIMYASPKMFDHIINSIVLMDDWMDELVPWEYYTSFRDPSDHRPLLVDFKF